MGFSKGSHASDSDPDSLSYQEFLMERIAFREAKGVKPCNQFPHVNSVTCLVPARSS